ncbi:hypothetical protein SYNPS1DRAFT_22698 [Syncephalis pseudoplumigaleata]|uniref:BAR domain-containing protein n=1 Tax=Syncephalis pseudoplumigaleata TaxID=1712513 RepID=A0A4P9Z0T8_9FUNG|nr:hypothetical protein SYNPS1DRAFT_22698 [Syncephalis pseudoplumigaleata]|eukprot:RKP25321.1 hypothetical protein SYNPS1DRAFT_22698 [Syncephalis pseudoplumigaleata]
MSSKTETSEEFRKLEQEIDAKRDFVENISGVSETYMKTLTKRTKADKSLIVESLGTTMSALGSQLSNDSEYGKSLIKTGEGLQQIAEIQLQYSVKLKAGFMNSLERQLRKRLEARRLDFDSKTNKVQKSKKERPELEEDMRAAQARYEEVMADTHNKMVSISELEEVQHRDLIDFVEAQLEYFRKGMEIMTKVQQSLGDPASAEAKRRTSQTDERNAETADTQSILSKYVEALYNYDATDGDELSIAKGDIIAVIEELDEGWWVGELHR